MTLLRDALVVAAIYYLLARAEATRWLWSRYPKSWDGLVLCPACAGAWIGAAWALRGDGWLAAAFLTASSIVGAGFGFGNKPVVAYAAGHAAMALAAMVARMPFHNGEVAVATALGMVTTPILFGALRWGMKQAEVKS